MRRFRAKEPWAWVKTGVFLALFAYFVSRVGHSVQRLNDGRIGTSVAFSQSHTVLFPAMTFCPMTIDREINLKTDVSILDVEPTFNVSELLLDLVIGISQR